MKFYAQLDANGRVVSMMVSHDIAESYRLEHNIVEISDTDYNNMDRLLIDHDVIVSDSGTVQAYQRLDHGLDMSRKQLNQYVSDFIDHGFVYKNNRFRASYYHQINLLLKGRKSTGGKFKTGDGKFVELSHEQVDELADALSNFLDTCMNIHWDAKEKLNTAESFEEMHEIVNNTKSLLETYRANIEASMTESGQEIVK